MREKAALPIKCIAVGTALFAIGWLTGLSLTGAGIGCILGGLATLAWRTGRHYEWR